MDIHESLDGWWHAYFDTASAWQFELTAPQTHTAHITSEDREYLDDHKESVKVPGIWRDSKPGFSGVVWYWRPFVVPADWGDRVVSLSLGAVCGKMEVYLDEVLIGNRDSFDSPFECDLYQLVPDKPYSLILRIAHYDDSGGICGPVTLYCSLPDVLDI